MCINISPVAQTPRSEKNTTSLDDDEDIAEEIEEQLSGGEDLLKSETSVVSTLDSSFYLYAPVSCQSSWQWDLAYESMARLKLNRTEMSMIRWMYGVKPNERKKSEELW